MVFYSPEGVAWREPVAWPDGEPEAAAERREDEAEAEPG